MAQFMSYNRTNNLFGHCRVTKQAIHQNMAPMISGEPNGAQSPFCRPPKGNTEGVHLLHIRKMTLE